MADLPMRKKNAVLSIQAEDVAPDEFKPKAYAYDIEVYPNFFCASFLHLFSEERHSFIIFQDPRSRQYDRNDLKALIQFIELRVKVLVGYNNFNYDDTIVKFLITSYDMIRNEIPKDIAASCKVLSDKIINRQKGKQKDNHLESLRMTKRFESKDLIELFNTINRVSLKQLAINIKWHRIMDLPYPPHHVVMAEEIESIIDYNFNDCEITRAIFFKLKPQIEERVQFSNQIGINVTNASDTNCAKMILRKYYSDATGLHYDTYKDKRSYYKLIPLKHCIPKKINFETQHYQNAYDAIARTTINPNIKSSDKKKKQFEYIHSSKYLTHTLGLGGIHSNNPPEIMEEDDDFLYADIDVQSYYPKILINERLYPRHLGPSFIDVYEHKIFWPRIHAKESGNDVLAQFLKISANSTFGLTKSQFSWLYDPYVATKICISGELYMLMLMERLELHTDCIVIYSNTDGMTVKVPRTQVKQFKAICDQWMEYTNFTLEFTKFRKMVIKDVNNFLIITHDRKKPIKMKGDFLINPPLTSGYNFPVVAKALYEFYVNGTSPEYYIKHEKDPYEFMRAVRTSVDKYNLDFFSKSDPDNPVSQAKSNRWIVTKGAHDEGKLLKYSLARHKHENLQKGVLVTLTNDVDKNRKIEDYKVNYDFYIQETFKIIREIKRKNKTTHHSQVKQLALL